VDALGRNPVCANTALISLAAAVGAKGYITGEDFNDIQRCWIGLEIDCIRKVSELGRSLLRGRGFGVTSCAGVRRGPAFWRCDVSVHRCGGFDPSVGGRRRWDAGGAGRA
jgi:hypothetical protein